ncbi:predicted protein [Streptomyces lividans TK24]|uniref:Integral membrane protein n=1 Tax=Streptomyces lividans 1326 TaxID=1200984 RepID=A0A7U9E284_STRLI|nr:predicted protein [Streptomyces lividans TK24]EOY52745.1 integral membrane protein [Streptomyces lividans 1326]
MLDGTPESAVIGVSLLDGAAVSLVTVGLRGVGCRRRGEHPLRVPRAPCTVVGGFSPAVIAAVTAAAAGAILAMIADTMIPEGSRTPTSSSVCSP